MTEQHISPLALVGGRVRHVEELCREAVATDRNGNGELSDMADLAQTILNVLRGNDDHEITKEIVARRKPLRQRIAESQLRQVNP